MDFFATFDLVSHKFLDRDLSKAGASDKLKDLFRAVYKSVTAFTKVVYADDKFAKSGVFPIHRGLL